MCNKAKMREAREDFFDVMAEDAGKCEMRGTNSKHHSMCVISESDGKNEHHFLLLFDFNGNV
jgi:hypothetical protein